jgi:VIT1/CCC1 family predicted Fe2+/Mn2+ transporter
MWMSDEEKVSSIEASFSMENADFDDECRQRISDILKDRITVSETIEELNRKYRLKY